MKRYILLFSLISLLTGCGSKDDPTPPPAPITTEITVDKPELNAAARGEVFTVSLTSNVAWQIVGANDWVAVEAASGAAGTVQVKITVSENKAYAVRNVTLTVMAKGKATKASSQVIIVRQAEPGALTLSEKDKTVSRKSSVLNVSLLTNVEYTYSDDAPWITPVETKALVPHTIKFDIAENPTLKERVGVITFTDKNSQLNDKITVRQQPNGTIVAEQTRAWDGVKRGDIFYEIFVRSFADSDGDGIGDLNGITAKLDYLQSLGVAGVWLTPINPSPSYHGYDVTDFKAVNPQFGTMADFENLVAKAKEKNIKVILDFVINHTSQEHPWFVKAKADPQSEERSYYTFVPTATVKSDCENDLVPMVDDKTYASNWWYTSGTDKYYAMFWSGMPDLNYGRVPNLTPVYDKMIDAAEFWMQKGAAGLRLDAVKHIYQNERGEQNIKLLNKFYTDLKAKYNDIYMIGEVLSGTDDSKEFLRAIPSVFHFDSWWKLDDALGKAVGRYYAKDMSDAMAKFSIQSAYRTVGTKLSNHDEDRAMSKLGRNQEKARIALASIMTTPGQPYIYYGEEVGMYGMKDMDDKNVREPLLWGDSYTATWTSTKTVPTVAVQSADEGSLLSFYREFTKIRNTYPSLSGGTMTYPDPADTPNELMVLTRAAEGEKLMIVANFSGNELEYSIQESAKNVVKSHAGARLLKFTDGASVAEMKPYSILIVEISSVQ